ncbi:hypothetical protein Ahia01_000536400 [Argonauta hians]
MFNREEFDNLTLLSVGRLYLDKETELVRMLQRNGLLYSGGGACTSCGHAMKEAVVNSKLLWRCSYSYCRRIRALRRGSVFENSFLKMWQIVLLSIFWSYSCGSARGLSYRHIQKETGIKSQSTIVEWMQFFRGIAVKYLARNPRLLGGEHLIVEIESVVVQPSAVKKQYIFCGYCRTTKKGFLIPVPNRKAQTFLPLIRQYIRPGSTIYSGESCADSGIEAIVGGNYTLKTVNRSENFVISEPGVHTNGVQSMWSRAKSKTQAMNGTSRSFLHEYAAEFMFRQEFEDDILVQLWRTISELYPFDTGVMGGDKEEEEEGDRWENCAEKKKSKGN